MGERSLGLTFPRTFGSWLIRCVSASRVCITYSSHHERTIGVLKSRVCCKHGVVGFHDGVRHRRGRVDTELQLRLLAIVSRQALEGESTKTRASSTAEGVEHEKALQTVAVVRETTNLVHDGIDHFLTNGVVTASIFKAPHVSKH